MEKLAGSHFMPTGSNITIHSMKAKLEFSKMNCLKKSLLLLRRRPYRNRRSTWIPGTRNLQMRVDAENGATAGKTDLAKLCKKYNLDALHDTIHEMARDEARHGKALKGLLERYFK